MEKFQLHKKQIQSNHTHRIAKTPKNSNLTNHMASFQITLSNTAARKAYKHFASALLDKVFGENDHVDQETVMQVRALRNRGDAILNELLEEVGTVAKSPAKKDKKKKSPSKKQMKIDGLKAELIQLGGEVPTELTVTSLRAAIKTAKKAAKSAKKSKLPKAKKVKKKAALMDQANKRKALQAKKAAKAEAKLEAKAAKIQTKVDALVKEILSYVTLNNLNAADEKALRERVKEVDEHCTGSLTTGVTMKEMKSILKEQKTLKAKADSPRQQKMKNLQDELTEIGGDMPETVSITTLRSAIKARKKQLKVEAKELAKAEKEAAKAEKAAKKAAKAKLPKKPSNAYMIYSNSTRGDVRKGHPDLKMPAVTKIIATNWKALSDAEKAPFVKAAAEDKVRYAAEMEKLGLAVTKSKSAKKATKSTTASEVTSSQKDLIAALVEDSVDHLEPSSELEEEELSDLEDDDSCDEDSDEEEVEFPGEDNVEEFEHSSRPGEQLFIDEEFHVWNSDEDLIGTYDAESKTLYED